MKAFPQKYPIDASKPHHEDNNPLDRGMELRDYFASQALAGGLEQGVENDMQTNWWHSPERIAKRAYAIADAMMEERDE
jgi:hypothetical protein